MARMFKMMMNGMGQVGPAAPSSEGGGAAAPMTPFPDAVRVLVANEQNLNPPVATRIEDRMLVNLTGKDPILAKGGGYLANTIYWKPFPDDQSYAIVMPYNGPDVGKILLVPYKSMKSDWSVLAVPATALVEPYLPNDVRAGDTGLIAYPNLWMTPTKEPKIDFPTFMYWVEVGYNHIAGGINQAQNRNLDAAGNFRNDAHKVNDMLEAQLVLLIAKGEITMAEAVDLKKEIIGRFNDAIEQLNKEIDKAGSTIGWLLSYLENIDTQLGKFFKNFTFGRYERLVKMYRGLNDHIKAIEESAASIDSIAQDRRIPEDTEDIKTLRMYVLSLKTTLAGIDNSLRTSQIDVAQVRKDAGLSDLGAWPVLAAAAAYIGKVIMAILRAIWWLLRMIGRFMQILWQLLKTPFPIGQSLTKVGAEMQVAVSYTTGVAIITKVALAAGVTGLSVSYVTAVMEHRQWSPWSDIKTSIVGKPAEKPGEPAAPGTGPKQAPPQVVPTPTPEEIDRATKDINRRYTNGWKKAADSASEFANLLYTLNPDKEELKQYAETTKTVKDHYTNQVPKIIEEQTGIKPVKFAPWVTPDWMPTIVIGGGIAALAAYVLWGRRK